MEAQTEAEEEKQTEEKKQAVAAKEAAGAEVVAAGYAAGKRHLLFGGLKSEPLRYGRGETGGRALEEKQAASIVEGAETVSLSEASLRLVSAMQASFAGN